MSASATPLRLLFVAGEQPDSETRAALDEQIDSYTLDTERTPAAALDRIRAESVDCLVSEYELPDSDGIALLQSVREIDSDLPFILLAADGDDSLASVATEHGVSRYLPHGQPDRLATNIVETVGRRSDLERQVRRYEQILESLDDAVYAIEPDGTIVYTNERYAEMKGVDRAELLGTDIDSWIAEETKEKVERARETLAAGDSNVGTVEYDFLTMDGERFPAELRFTSSVPDSEGFDRAGVIRDVSERVAREQSLRETNDRLDEFASIVSHDLRNPLDVAQTRLELAQETTDSEQLDEIGTALDRMERLLEDLLALARQGQTIEEKQPVSLQRLATTAWAAVDTTDAQLEIKSSLTLLADGPRLEQLLENLYRNATEHADSAVTVRVGDLPDRDGFYLADDGPGIPPEQRTTVFEYGYTTAADGTGFGLSIVEDIADAHGWEIRVTDSDSGGARFEIADIETVSD
jgi:PAS domain S-box-containing protein